MNNKLTFNGTEYELIEIQDGTDYVNVGIPNISFKGKLFYGKAIVDKRWPVDGPPEQKSEEQKEWEVLSFDYNGGFRYNARGDGRFIMVDSLIPSMSAPLYEVPSSARILSVKRLTDGEAFSIGDYVHQISGHKITRIIIGGAPQNPKQDGSLVWLSTSPDPYHHGVDLMVATKYKPKPIFKTHDGVEYFEGQEDEQVFLIKADWSKYSDKVKGAVGNPKGRLYFSTKVAAKNFILKNKPTLSHNDVIMFLDAIKMEIPAQHMGSFIKMIESKL